MDKRQEALNLLHGIYREIRMMRQQQEAQPQPDQQEDQAPRVPGMDPWLTIRQAAWIVDRAPSTVDTWVSRGLVTRCQRSIDGTTLVSARQVVDLDRQRPRIKRGSK